MDAVCKACKPPPISSTAAITPTDMAQNIRRLTGESILPPEVRLTITKEPESAEVTKKPMIKTIPMTERTMGRGNCSKKTKSAVEISLDTAVAMDRSPERTSLIAVLPKVLIQK